MRKTLYLLARTISVVVLWLALSTLIAGDALAATITWDGGGGDNNWSTCANWSGDTCPTNLDDVVFSSTSTKNATVDGSFGGVVRSVAINTGYSGTIDLARSLQTTNSFSQTTGTFTAGSQSLDVGASFILSGGTFTASSGTTTLRLAISISGGTFNHNSGTLAHIHAAGNTYSFSCNNVAFNLVTLNTNGVLTINSNCSLPLGSNPTIPGNGDIRLSGTLSGSGTFTRSTTFQPLVMNAGASLSGFTGFNSPLTVSGATADFSSYTTFTTPSTGNLTLSSGTLTLPSGADLNAALIISGGIFNAPSGTMTVAGSLTVSGSPTFNANGGTINFDATGVAAYTCNNVTFNNIILSNGGNKTINSGCSFNLGNNPTISSTLTINGSISGTGTFTNTINTTTFNSGSSISGFSGLNLSQLAVSGGNVDFSTYSTFVINSTATVSSGSISLPNGADFNGPLTISGGTFNAPSGSMFLAGALTITGTPTFNANGGTFTFDGSSDANLTCNGVSFNLVVFANTGGGSRNVLSNCTIPLGNNPVVTGRVRLNSSTATITGSGLFTSTSEQSSALRLTNGTFSGFSGMVIHGQLQLDGANLDLSNYSPLIVYGKGSSNALNISAGSSFTAPLGVMKLYDTFVNTATFNHNNGTVEFLSTDTDKTIGITSGAASFYNLQATEVVSGTTFFFTNAQTQTITNNLTLKGSSTDNLSLRSFSDGTQWQINAQGSRTLQYLSVKDSSNVNGLAMTAVCSTDLGNNTGWLFPPCDGSLFNLVSPSDRTYTRDERSTFSWRPPSDRSMFDAAREYSLIVDTGTTTNLKVEGIPAQRPSGSNFYETATYRVDYLNWDNEDLADNLISLVTKSSNTWSSDYNDGRLTEGKRNWRVQLKDASNTLYEVSNELYVDFTPPTTSLSQINNLTYVPAVLTTDSTPTIFGKVIDPLKGSPEDRQVASGPKSILISIEKKTNFGYQQTLRDTITLSKMFWQNDGSEIVDKAKQTSSKYSPFEYTLTKELEYGTYRITLTPLDQAGNEYFSQVFQIRVVGQSDVWPVMTEAQQQDFESDKNNTPEITIPDPDEDQAKIEEQLKIEAEKGVLGQVKAEQRIRGRRIAWVLGTLGLVLVFWFLLFWKRRKKKKEAVK